MFNHIEKLGKLVIILAALAIGLLLILLPRTCQAQLPGVPVSDCCTQTIEWKGKYNALQVKYVEVRRDLDSLIAIDDRIIQATDKRLAQTLKNAESKLAAEQQRNDELAKKNETLAASVDDCNVENERLADEVKQWKPATQIGVAVGKFRRAVNAIGRTVRDGLAIIGGVAILVGTYIIVR